MTCRSSRVVRGTQDLGGTLVSLIDVALVLLLYFMTEANGGVHVESDQQHRADSSSDQQTVLVVELSDNGKILLDDRVIVLKDFAQYLDSAQPDALVVNSASNQVDHLSQLRDIVWSHNRQAKFSWKLKKRDAR